MKKTFFLLMLFVFLSLVSAVLFIKFNTQVAAEFTDNTLRPLLGAKVVIFLEKIFFNASDKVQKVTSSEKSVSAPTVEFLANDSLKNSLNLSAIPPITHFSLLRNEGVWKLIKLNQFPDDSVIATTFVRPDQDRPYAVVTIAQVDMSKVMLAAVAGIKEPGGKVGNPGPGKVPDQIVKSNSLVAAFDGGFQYRDGQYGMIVNDKVYLPLQNDLGTLVGYKDGTLKIIDYGGEDLGKNISFIRQNCPILIKNGVIGLEDQKNKKLWGRTLTTDIYTWRTGVGIDKSGHLLFAVGNNLTPETLAKALKMAGAENAMQLDINPNWVRFNIFSSLGNGNYDSRPLTNDLKDGTTSYLNGYSKDFFYIYKK